MKTSIIIPLFNRWDLTQQCLATLLTQLNPDQDELILVNNASTDATAAELAKLTGVRVINNDVNQNFSGACNQGAAIATGDILVFLNNDTVPFDGWLDAIREEFTKPEVAIVGAKLIYPNGTIQHAGVCTMRENCFPYHPYRGMAGDIPEVNRRRELRIVTGACMATTPAWFTRMGMFDNLFRNGGEDVDYCLKVWSAGGKVIYQPKCCLIHFESQSPGRMDFNEANCVKYKELWPDMFLGDEDEFFHHDKLHRVGYRTSAVGMPHLAKIETEEEEKQWGLVAECQHLYGAKGVYKSSLMASAESWPADSALREWAALFCIRDGDYQAACRHFLAGYKAKLAEEHKRLLNEYMTYQYKFSKIN